MKQRPRIYYNEAQKALMWERWRKGESLQHIAELFDRNHSSIQRILAETGALDFEWSVIDVGVKVAASWLAEMS